MKVGPFKNEPLVDWSREENRKKAQEAILRVRGQLGKVYPLIIGNQRLPLYKKFSSLNPADFQEVVGLVSSGDRVWVDAACQEAFRAWNSWQFVSWTERAAYLFKAAEIMRKRRFELIAWVILEVGKNWEEADADIAEAIDFLEYYGRRMLELGPSRLTEEVLGEKNEAYYVPQGVWAVLGTWNFPFSINVGMASAAIVAGNAVVFKPASASAVIGYKIAEIFMEAGLPNGVLNFLPGSASEVGEELVKHPKVIQIAVTGSKETGLRIEELCSQYRCEYGIKGIGVGEFGGKGKIIIDEDADLDEAVRGVRDSWLGAQGQKCSACSVLITVGDEVHDLLLLRLIEAAKSVKVGLPEDSSTFLGPLIDEKALNKVRDYVEIGKSESRLAYIGQIPKELGQQGYYHPPVIFDDVSSGARIAQEEIFGPVLAIVRAKSFDEAIDIFNHSQYALTGGVFSRLPSHIELAKRKCNAGNLYINRKITGALVGRQPFGGWKYSGIGSKAGSPNYLLRFMYEKTVTEDERRKGFAPIDPKTLG